MTSKGMRWRLAAAGTFVSLATLALRCDLNPQPLPPGQRGADFNPGTPITVPAEASVASEDGGYSGASSGGGLLLGDSASPMYANDGGAGGGRDAGSESGGSGGGDALAADAAMDASVDAPSEGGSAPDDAPSTSCDCQEGGP